MSWLVGAAVTATVLAARGPRGRRPARVARPARDGLAARTGAGRGRAPGAAGRLGFPPWWRRRSRAGGPDLAVLVADVAGRLRAGADPATAWRAVLGDAVPDGGPTLDQLATRHGDRAQATVVVAAGRLAAELGTPLAPMLDAVVAQLAGAAEAEADRRAALAGPRASARVLTWLPVLGVLLGAALGADPAAVLLDGGTGSLALAAGLLLLVAGRVWTHRLARAAAAAGRSA